MRQVSTDMLLALAAAGSLAGSASAQCPDWRDQPPLRRSAVVRAITPWDPDGAGPQQPWLVVAGQFERAGSLPVSNVAAWDGSSWRALDAGIMNTSDLGVQSLVVYNGQLIAGGNFAFAGTEVCFNIARWNGSSWQPLGDGIFGDSPHTAVRALAVYNNELIAAGRFAEAGGFPARNIARWNGSQWRALDTGIRGNLPTTDGVSSLAVYGGQLYAGGHFDLAGSVPCRNIARWNGSTWQAVTGGVGVDSWEQHVYAMTVHSGELVVGGLFTSLGGGAATCNNIARWNGTTWAGLGAPACGVNDTVYALASLGGSLYASGDFAEAGGAPASRIARWDGTGWHAMGEGTNRWTGALAIHDGQLVVGGYLGRAGPHNVDSLARWDGTRWLPQPPVGGIRGEPLGHIAAISPWAGTVVIGGSHDALSPDGGTSLSLLTAWDGVEISGIGHPNSTVRCMMTTPGPAGSTDLIVGGDFWEIDGLPFNRIARRSDTPGAQWQNIGQGFSGSVRALEMHNGSLYAGGHFFSSGSTTLNFIARWNGTAWVPLGSGLSGSVNAIKSFDGLLVVGGDFTTAGGIPARGLAAWTGTTWLPLHATAFVGSVNALAIYDNVLAIGGQFPGVAGSANISWFGGEIFGTFGSGTNAPVRALTVSNGTLVAGGDFTTAGGLSAAHLARWNGHIWPPGAGAWSAWPGATDGPVHSLAAIGNELHVGGEFIDVRSETLYSPLWARYSEDGVPWVAAHPAPAQAQCGGQAGFHVAPASGYAGLAYQWRKSGVVLAAGPTSSGSTIVLSGPDLEIQGVTPADAGVYDCVVSNACGAATSLAAALTVVGDCPPACPADFNADGAVNSQDFFDFLTAFFAAVPAADFNGDAAVNSQDFFDFLTAFFAGCG